MVARVMVVTLNYYVDSGLAKLAGEVMFIAVIGFNLDAEAAVKSVVYFRKNCSCRLMVKSACLKHFFVNVLHETVVSVGYQVGYLAAG